MNLTANQTRIVNCLMNTEITFTYEQIIKETKLPRTTIINNLQSLVKLGIVEKTKLKRNGLKGRPKTIWSLI